MNAILLELRIFMASKLNAGILVFIIEIDFKDEVAVFFIGAEKGISFARVGSAYDSVAFNVIGGRTASLGESVEIFAVKEVLAGNGTTTGFFGFYLGWESESKYKKNCQSRGYKGF